MTTLVCTTKMTQVTSVGNAIAGSGNLCKHDSSNLFDNPSWADSYRPSNSILLAEQGRVPGVGLD